MNDRQISKIILSIIIPNYNHGDKIERCINSVLKQNSKAIEIIIIDDGSTDNSMEILNNKYKNNSQIIIKHQKNQGAGMARNNGIKIAHGKYIWFVDADDVIELNSINHNFLLDLQKENYDLVLFGAREVKPNGKIKNFSSNFNGIITTNNFAQNFSKIFDNNLLNEQCNKLYKKDFLIKEKIFYGSQSVGEDAIFNFKVLSVFKKMLVIDSIKYVYFLYTTSNSPARKKEDKNKNIIKMITYFDNLINKYNISHTNTTYNEALINSIIDIEKNNILQYGYKLSSIQSSEVTNLRKRICFKRLNTYYLIKGWIANSNILSLLYFKLVDR